MSDIRTFAEPEPACLLRLVSEQLHKHQPAQEAAPSERQCRCCGDRWPCTARAVAQSIDLAAVPTMGPPATEPPPKEAPADAGRPETCPADFWWSAGAAVGVASVPSPVSVAWQHGVSGDGAADVYTATPTWAGRS